MSQEEMAQSLGVSVRTIARFEAKDAHIPKRLRKAAQELVERHDELLKDKAMRCAKYRQERELAEEELRQRNELHKRVQQLVELEGGDESLLGRVYATLQQLDEEELLDVYEEVDIAGKSPLEQCTPDHIVQALYLAKGAKYIEGELESLKCGIADMLMRERQGGHNGHQ